MKKHVKMSSPKVHNSLITESKDMEMDEMTELKL
jgi:hypothetical protein